MPTFVKTTVCEKVGHPWRHLTANVLVEDFFHWHGPRLVGKSPNADTVETTADDSKRKRIEKEEFEERKKKFFDF